jgi:hypothetical protein
MCGRLSCCHTPHALFPVAATALAAALRSAQRLYYRCHAMVAGRMIYAGAAAAACCSPAASTCVQTDVDPAGLPAQQHHSHCAFNAAHLYHKQAAHHIHRHTAPCNAHSIITSWMPLHYAASFWPENAASAAAVHSAQSDWQLLSAVHCGAGSIQRCSTLYCMHWLP